jgi:Uma2 family endonuclease
MASTIRERRPTWELTDLLIPHQGDWTVEEYLQLDTNRLIEFTDGFLEFLPMPEEIHFYVQQFIFAAVEEFLKRRGKGAALYAPFKIRVRPAAFREPDVCVLLDENDRRRGRKYWAGADMVIEVVSPGGETRDYIEKRTDYADARIPEYWIVDPFKQVLHVLRLTEGAYFEQAVLRAGAVAESTALPGFQINVADCFAAANRAAKNDEPLLGGDE